MYCDSEKLKLFVKKVMKSAGLPEVPAALFADSLVFADMRGVSSHGVTRLAVYRKRLQSGQVDPIAMPEVTKAYPSMIHIDGHNTMGAPLAMHAMEECVKRAKVSGACFAAINHGNHFGCAGYFTKYAAEQGMIGVAMATANAIVAPTGSKQPMLGTNPFSIAIPAYEKAPFILDMATSVVANGKIVLARKEGHDIPAGWGMDENGVVTTDPNQVKFLMPFGDYKGYGVSLAIEMLSSVLARAENSRTAGSFWKPGDGNVQGTGFFVGAINPGAVMDPVEFAKGISATIDEMKAAKIADGATEVLVAGEPEQRKYEAALKDGVYVSDVVIEELKKLGEECGVEFDVAMA